MRAAARHVGGATAHRGDDARGVLHSCGACVCRVLRTMCPHQRRRIQHNNGKRGVHQRAQSRERQRRSRRLFAIHTCVVCVSERTRQVRQPSSQHAGGMGHHCRCRCGPVDCASNAVYTLTASAAHRSCRGCASRSKRRVERHSAECVGSSTSSFGSSPRGIQRGGQAARAVHSRVCGVCRASVCHVDSVLSKPLGGKRRDWLNRCR